MAPITLGDNVLIGPNVTLATPNHPFIAEERAYTDYPNGCHALEYAEPITIGDHCWLCAGATVCGGVTIGAGSIIAAGAVVLDEIPDNCTAVRKLYDFRIFNWILCAFAGDVHGRGRGIRQGCIGDRSANVVENILSFV